MIENRIQLTYCEGEAAPPATPTTPPTPETPTDRKFTQEEVNSFIKKEKESWRKSQEKQLDELKTLRETVNLSEQQKTEMDSRIKELEGQVLSKEELARRETQRLQEASKKEITGLSADRDHWRSLYTSDFIGSTLERAAKTAKAFNPEQIKMMLEGRTRLVPLTDEGGKATGKYKAEILWTEVKDGVATDIQVPVDEAVKRMKEAPERFGNLFETDAKGGIGGSNTPSTPKGGITPSSLSDPEEYRKHRERILGLKK
jgi:hypothetical protein